MTTLRAYGGPANGKQLSDKGVRNRYWTGIGKSVIYYREHYCRMREDGSIDRRWVWVADGTELPTPEEVFSHE